MGATAWKYIRLYFCLDQHKLRISSQKGLFVTFFFVLSFAFFPSGKSTQNNSDIYRGESAESNFILPALKAVIYNAATKEQFIEQKQENPGEFNTLISTVNTYRQIQGKYITKTKNIFWVLDFYNYFNSIMEGNGHTPSSIVFGG